MIRNALNTKEIRTYSEGPEEVWITVESTKGPSGWDVLLTHDQARALAHELLGLIGDVEAPCPAA